MQPSWASHGRIQPAWGEAVALALGLSPTDTPSLEETIQSTISKGVTDTAGLEETVAAFLGLSRTDTTSLGEAVALALGLSPTDTPSLEEAIQSTISKGVTDTAGLEETVAAALGLLRTDTATLGEAIALALGLSPTDTPSLEEAIQSAISKGVTDTAGLEEAVELTVHLGTANLGVTKADSPDPVLLEEELIYTLVVTNRGPSTGTGVTVIDTLPAGLSFVSASAGCTKSDNVVTCGLDPIASGDNATVTIVVIPNTTGDLTNTAIVTGSVGDLDTADNTTSQTTTVNPAADLSLRKVEFPDPVLLGSDLTYTLTVNNNGPSEATGVTLTDTLPADVSFLSASASCVEAGGTVTCAIGRIASGDSATVSIAVSPTTLSTITNTARVTSNHGDPNTGDNTATVTTSVNSAADLSLTKVDSSEPVLLESNLTYTLTVNNKGPSEATGVTLTDTLPAGVSFLSASAGCSEAGGTVTCTIGTIATGDTATVSIVVSPTAVSTITNTATVTGKEGDPTPANNTATETTTVNPGADLVLTKEDSLDPVLLGTELTYTLSIINKGPSEATGVTLTDTLPAGLNFLSTSAGCEEASGTVTCSIGALGGGERFTVKIVVTAASTGDHTNIASVTSSVADPNTGDNSATETTTVGPAADLVLTKADTPDPVLLGEELTYAISIINKGPSHDAIVTLTDTLPAGVRLISFSPSQGACSGTSLMSRKCLDI